MAVVVNIYGSSDKKLESKVYFEQENQILQFGTDCVLVTSTWLAKLPD